MKKILIIALSLVLVFALCACGSTGSTENAPSDPRSSEAIVLKGSTAEFKGGGVSITGNIVTISSGGEYTVTGTLDNGQIVINTGEDPTDVILTLDNANISNSNDAAIHVVQANSVTIVLPQGTQNSLVSGQESDMQLVNENSSGGAIFSEDDLDFDGEGSIKICGYINTAISCKDDVKIFGGNIELIAANNGIKGSESVQISGGNVTVTSQNDGIKSSSAKKEGKGFVEISGGNVTVTSGGDGISAETDLNISGGNISVTTNGNYELVSCRALKANTAMNISGGTFNLASSDHALHSSAGINISGGTFNLVSTARKGINASANIEISGGEIKIDSADDGIETKTDVIISGGNIEILSDANGIKAGEAGTGFGPVSGYVTVSGGSLRINALGDGIDAEAELIADGGTVFSLGTSKSLKGFTGGTQSFINCTLGGSEGAEASITAADGASVDTMTASFNFNTVLYTSPNLTSGTAYTLSSGAKQATVTP